MLTLRDVGAAAIKLFGLYFASRVVALYFALMVTPLILSPQAFSSTDPLLAASISSAVANLALALIALFASDRIAVALFPAMPLPLEGNRQDVLFVGIAILGLWIAADGAVAILRGAGAFVHYSQHQVPSASLERSWPRLIGDLIACVTGVILAVSARRVAARLDRS